MSLSLCMIVKDEADALPRCLASVRDSVDEMIVMDTGSQDDTIAVAQTWGAQVQSIEWTQDFAAARNQSLAQATGDWILVLDADETVTAAGRALLTRIRQSENLGAYPLDSVLLVSLLRHEINAVQAPYSPVSRLFRNRPDLRFDRPYHETVDDCALAIQVAEPRWQILAWPEVALEHTGYAADAIAQRDKFTRAQTLMAAYLETHPDDAYICNKLGALYGALGDWQRGKPLLERGLAAAAVDPYTTYELHYHLGLAARAAGALEQAATHYQAALEQTVPDVVKVGALINLGSVRQAQKDFAGAVEQFERATQVAPQLAMAYFNLGAAQRARGYLPAAIAAYQQAIQINPHYAEAYQNLGVALFKLGKLPESLQAMQQAIALYQRTNPAEAKRLQAGLRHLGFAPR